MNVMTYLGGILSGDKIFKGVFSCSLLFTVISILFLSSFASVFAQAGGIPGIDRPYRPGEAPPGMTTGTPLSPNDPNLLPPGYGRGAAGGNGASGADVAGDGVYGAEGQLTPPKFTAETPVGQIDNMALRMLHAVFVEGLGWVLGVFGYLFDFAIEHFIIGFGEKYLNSNLGDTIEALWSTVRDIFNLTFIFGLVYIGFKMILDSSDSSARRMLVYLIGAALLVNFSLFIIDSNS